MPDFGRELKFDYFLVPNASNPVVSIAQQVERRGSDYVAIQDHPYQRRYLDTWTLLSAIDGATANVGLLSDVANPAHPIGIWLGVYGPRALAWAARVADGWVPSLTGDVGAVAEMAGRLDNAAAGVGRDPGEIRRILNVPGVITDGSSNGALQGPVNQWVDDLADLVVTHGFDTFVLWAEGADQMPRFAEEVVPALRARVAHEGAGPRG